MSRLPDEKKVLDFLKASSVPVVWQELLKQFSISEADEKPFKKMVKKWVAGNVIRRLKGRRFMAPSTLQPPAPKASVPEKTGTEGPGGSLRARVVREGHFLFAVSGEGADRMKFVLPKQHQNGVRPGEMALVKPMGRRGPMGYPVGRILQGIRPTATFADVSNNFFKTHGLPHGYPKEAVREAESKPDPAAELPVGRLDLRSHYIVTIDPADAKDHDDAISLEKMADGRWKVGVHIADVSEYVDLDGALDEEALRRAFTNYLPWTAVPMLPQRLSGDLCSLLEGRDRLAFSCFMEVSKAGDLLKYEFAESFIRVAKFFSYEEAQIRKEEGDSFLGLLSEFTEMLLERRRREGTLEFSFPEPKVELDAQRQPVDIRPRARLASYSWIEECMLLCNQAAALYIHRYKLPGLFRVHEQPDLDVVDDLWNGALPLESRGKESLEGLKASQGYLNPALQAFYIRLLDPKRGALPPSVQRRILQSMKKAQYDPEPRGHFALGWKHYAHFTSPIRRYADLWTHRMMKLQLRGEKIPRPLRVRAVAIGGQVSEREIAVMKIERKSMRAAAAWIFKDLVGREFAGEISGVENFGIFVSVPHPFAEGLIPVARLRDDFYEKDESTGKLTGRRSGRSFELGLKIKVRVARSDPFSGQIDFDFLGRV